MCAITPSEEKYLTTFMKKYDHKVKNRIICPKMKVYPSPIKDRELRFKLLFIPTVKSDKHRKFTVLSKFCYKTFPHYVVWTLNVANGPLIKAFPRSIVTVQKVMEPLENGAQ